MELAVIYYSGLIDILDTPTEINGNGTKMWRNKEGKLHRDNDLPAVVINSGGGRLLWFQNGKLHRDNGPAAIYEGGEEWYKNGSRHRDDGPAMVWYNHDSHVYNNVCYASAKIREEWYQNGKLHREDGPARTSYNSAGIAKKCYKNGLLHSYNDNPAVYIENYAGTEVIMRWFKDGVLHRDNGPADYRSKGKVADWYKDGTMVCQVYDYVMGNRTKSAKK